MNLLRKLYHKIRAKDRFESSDTYWKSRYKKGGNSGAGSYGQLAEFKSEVINKFIQENGIKSAVEFGCGDGNQCSFFKLNHYVGVDIAESVILSNRSKFEKDPSKEFYLYIDFFKKYPEGFDMTMSLDVIYHLVEDDVYSHYMTNLFSNARKYVVIYSSNFDSGQTSHVRHRKFTSWIEENEGNWVLIQKVPNKYFYDPQNPNSTSSAEFYIYAKTLE